MNKTDLVSTVSSNTNLSKKDAEAAVDQVFEVISSALKKGDKVSIAGFGTFDVTSRAAREGRNPKTGEKMMIAASKTPKFKAGKALKDLVN